MEGVKFNLEEMENMYVEASNHEANFRNGIEEINNIVSQIHDIWTSEETGTYEAFENLFKEKYPKLQEGDDCMKKFCEKVQEKKEDFKQAAQDSINLFE